MPAGNMKLKYCVVVKRCRPILPRNYANALLLFGICMDRQRQLSGRRQIELKRERNRLARRSPILKFMHSMLTGSWLVLVCRENSILVVMALGVVILTARI